MYKLRCLIIHTLLLISLATSKYGTKNLKRTELIIYLVRIYEKYYTLIAIFTKRCIQKNRFRYVIIRFRLKIIKQNSIFIDF